MKHLHACLAHGGRFRSALNPCALGVDLTPGLHQNPVYILLLTTQGLSCTYDCTITNPSVCLQAKHTSTPVPKQNKGPYTHTGPQSVARDSVDVSA